jgi:vesicle coat complex subunit
MLGHLGKLFSENQACFTQGASFVACRLQHANTAVVLSAVKVLLKYMEYIEDKDFVKNMERKLAPPLGTYAETWQVSPLSKMLCDALSLAWQLHASCWRLLH